MASELFVFALSACLVTAFGDVTQATATRANATRSSASATWSKSWANRQRTSAATASSTIAFPVFTRLATTTPHSPTIAIATDTPCNKTYYGVAGRTYELEVPRPQDDELPFICHLNFTALGGAMGDFIQLTFDTFTVGRFDGLGADGCPDGYMAVAEQGRPESGGRWCGAAWGYTVYYSETPSVNVTLRLDRLAQQGVGYNFDLKLSYKLLRKDDIRLRNEGGAWTGELVPGTYCSRELHDCDIRPCRIRSPNYPGVYPRNLTCTYRVRQRAPPPGAHAMLAVRQPDGHKLHIKEQAPHYERGQRLIRNWEQCDPAQDQLSIRDGLESSAPELARMCGGGGDAFPDVVTSGPEMLLEFRTSPCDSPFHPVPVTYLPGFELEVQVIFVNAQSHSYVRKSGHCEFIINAFEGSSGVIENPRHSLPPQTACRYYFQGRHHEVVWLSFVKYHAAPDPATFGPPTECFAQLKIWDGRASVSKDSNVDSSDNQNLYKQNATLLGEICKEETPKLCPRSLISKGARPCSPTESYLSSGSDMTLEYRVGRSGPAPIFKLRYEFVDIYMGGAVITNDPSSHSSALLSQPSPLYQMAESPVTSIISPPCNRVYRSTAGSRGVFKSPQNVFLYGRGGAQNISCIMRFEGDPGESIRLTITHASFGGRNCVNYHDPKSGNWHCNYRHSHTADVRILEIPWDGVNIQRDCICSNETQPIIISPLASHTIELHFNVLMMSVEQDFKDFFYEGTYEFLNDGCDTDWDDRKLKGISGNLEIRLPQCSPIAQPWLIEPELNASHLVLKLNGFWLPVKPPMECPVETRIVVYPAASPSTFRELCPFGSEVAVFSEGLRANNILGPPYLTHSRSLIVEIRQYGSQTLTNYKISWIEVIGGPDRLHDCAYRCPELEACLPASLWCDGVAHCPSGHDESPLVCHTPSPLKPLYVGLVAAAFTILLATIAGLTACAKRIRNEKKSSHLHSNGAQYPIHTHQLPLPIHNTHLMNHTAHHSHTRQLSDDLYYDGKDSFC